MPKKISDKNIKKRDPVIIEKMYNTKYAKLYFK